jgi:hypothetical protein
MMILPRGTGYLIQVTPTRPFFSTANRCSQQASMKATDASPGVLAWLLSSYSKCSASLQMQDSSQVINQFQYVSCLSPRPPTKKPRR